MSRIPVFILSGFLGSGKTTLLLRLLHEAEQRQLKAAVLMNELGKFDVDGGLIRNDIPERSLEKLLDGCICCSKKSEVVNSLRKLIDQQPDVLFIELTGVANPEEVVDALTEPFLLNRVELRQIITVLDSEGVLDYNSFFNTDLALKHTLRRQMEVADTILINKTDLVPSPQLLKIEKAVKKQNHAAVLYFTKQSEMPMEALFADLQSLVHPSLVRPKSGSGMKVVRKQAGTAPTSEPKHGHHEHSEAKPAASFSRVQSLTLPLPQDQPVTAKQIEQFIHQWKGQLLRAKGYAVVSDKRSKYQVVQFAGKRLYWEAADEPGPSYLVLIGIDMDQNQIKQAWSNTIT
ncbi:CobW family GTP-binding protein [Paenibacillus sp. 1P07SE]|uniref:CobW family GTP-binding protein n=1 Tax=Paenibacillus sp. 1P07SE TaxID=3132209 RepID=UPI0039A4F3AE